MAVIVQAFFEKSGYCVIKRCIPPQIIADFVSFLESSNVNDTPTQSESKGVTTKDKISAGEKHYRLLELHKTEDSAKKIASNQTITDYISLFFGNPRHPIQSLTFVWPTEQHIHQDWPYVTTIKNNNHMIGAWVACEKVTLDNGPLFYYPKSHLIERFKFADNWAENGDEWISKFEYYLSDAMRNTKPHFFTAEPGDVLLWHGDLIHGGSLANNPELTRKSIVIHYTC